MNWESDEPESYYARKEREHMELLQCYCYAVLLGVAIAAAAAAVLGGYALARWLIGGA